MDISIKIFLTVWAMSLLIGTVCFYMPGKVCDKISLIMGLVCFIACPVVLVMAIVLGLIWG